MGTGEEIKGKESRKVKMSREKLGRSREGTQTDDDKDSPVWKFRNGKKECPRQRRILTKQNRK